MIGRSVVRGTRIIVEIILGKLAAGGTEDGLLAARPRLTREAIRPVKTLRSG